MPIKWLDPDTGEYVHGIFGWDADNNSDMVLALDDGRVFRFKNAYPIDIEPDYKSSSP
jgi:hypothetical protein